jgi:hypothetical protein
MKDSAYLLNLIKRMIPFYEQSSYVSYDEHSAVEAESLDRELNELFPKELNK